MTISMYMHFVWDLCSDNVGIGSYIRCFKWGSGFLVRRSCFRVRFQEQELPIV